MKPIKDRILGRVIEPEPTKGGLILNLEGDTTRYKAEVVDTGPLVKYYEKGDVFMYDPDLSEEYVENSVKYVWVRESEGVI